MEVQVIKQYSVFMPNQAGTLSHLAERFAESGINILGITSEVRDDSALVRIAVARDAAAGHVLSKAGFASVESKLLSVELDDAPGQLSRVTQALGEGGVNITTVYATAVREQVSRILIGVEDADEAAKILEKS
jgi:hypothetical protein